MTDGLCIAAALLVAVVAFFLIRRAGLFVLDVYVALKKRREHHGRGFWI
jgi:hypothetical protein